ncbi:NAD(P)H-binding protein [Spongiactinospora sp. TRM90649]|uniref:NAD(P)H-binding protein n=1 Tax=Spongiactinospora sp. TRM90649 TaxID=3031114 RepID=UPI0023F75BB1|nr:NAD(P)H-binding protein [Spongiactinospora sp. TRM90649]MDF5759326.1 NAD(P)H-binding protein [Spongiactinospora sp. TRM90649]
MPVPGHSPRGHRRGPQSRETADSDLDWTVVRPPRLTDKPLTGVYRTAVGRNLKHCLLISRADGAHLMLAALTRHETVRQTVGIAY